MVNCEKVRELASEYRDGMLPDTLERSVREHAAACAACSRDLESLDRVWNDLEALPELDTPLFFHENIMTAVESVAITRPSWRDLLPRLGRIALGTAAVAGAVAAAAWTLLLPSPVPMPSQQASALPFRGTVLPGDSAAASTEAPRLRVARSSVLLGDGEAALQFAFWLEGAGRGSVRIHLLSNGKSTPEGTPVRFLLQGSVPQALVIPDSAVTGDTVDLHVFWTADGVSKSRVLFVPIHRTDTVPAPRQSFGLPQGTLYQAAREVAVRYGVPVTVEDVQDVADITVVAREETAADALGRALGETDLDVSVAGGGLLVRHQAEASRSVRP